MDFETIRPLISGTLGGLVALWIGYKLRRKVPLAGKPTEQQTLVESQKGTVRAANIAASIGIGVGLILYLGGILDSRDWRGLGLMFGLLGFLPLLVITVRNARNGLEGIKAGLTAYAISQKSPPALLYAAMFLMSLGGVWAVIAFLR